MDTAILSTFKFHRFITTARDRRSKKTIHKRSSINIERSMARGYYQSSEPDFSRITRKLLRRAPQIDHFFSAYPITFDIKISRTLARFHLNATRTLITLKSRKSRLSRRVNNYPRVSLQISSQITVIKKIGIISSKLREQK